MNTISFISLFAAALIYSANCQAQCIAEYTDSGSGLLCDFSVDGKPRVQVENGDGISSDASKKHARRVMTRWARQSVKERRKIKNALSIFDPNPPSQAVMDLKDEELITELVERSLSGSDLVDSDLVIEPSDSLVIAEEKLEQIVSELGKGIRKNNNKKKRNRRVNRFYRKCTKNRLKPDQCDSEFSCNNQSDDDSDGFIDCDDSDCVGRGGCSDCADFEIPGQFVIKTAYNNSAGACGTHALVQWSDADDEGAVSWRVHYSWNGDPRSYSTSPPFDDTFTTHETEFTVPGGSHWDTIGPGTHRTSGSGDPVDCSEFPPRYNAALSNPYLVVRICGE